MMPTTWPRNKNRERKGEEWGDENQAEEESKNIGSLEREGRFVFSICFLRSAYLSMSMSLNSFSESMKRMKIHDGNK